VLAGAARSTCIIGLADRPLFLALVVGCCTGDWTSALALGIITELCWLDVLELGSVVPPYAGLSFLLAFPLCHYFGLVSPGEALLPLLLSLTAACAAAWRERRQRLALNPLMDAVADACRTGRGMSPGRAVLLAGLRRAGEQGLLYAVCFGVIAAVLAELQRHEALPAPDTVSWSALFGAALLGAVLSLRTRQAYGVLLAALSMLALCIWANL
jgi:PTS system mannose-specific IIC component